MGNDASSMNENPMNSGNVPNTHTTEQTKSFNHTKYYVRHNQIKDEREARQEDAKVEEKRLLIIVTTSLLLLFCLVCLLL